MGCNTTIISSVSEYVSFFESLPEGVCYRGVSNKGYALIPSVGRIADGVSKNAVLCKEYKAFCLFQREYALICSG